MNTLTELILLVCISTSLIIIFIINCFLRSFKFYRKHSVSVSISIFMLCSTLSFLIFFNHHDKLVKICSLYKNFFEDFWNLRKEVQSDLSFIKSSWVLAIIFLILFIANLTLLLVFVCKPTKKYVCCNSFEFGISLFLCITLFLQLLYTQKLNISLIVLSLTFIPIILRLLLHNDETNIYVPQCTACCLLLLWFFFYPTELLNKTLDVVTLIIMLPLGAVLGLVFCLPLFLGGGGDDSISESNPKESISHMTARLQNRLTTNDWDEEVEIVGDHAEDRFGNKEFDIVEENEMWVKDTKGHYHIKNKYK